jgi:hypothetical protein
MATKPSSAVRIGESGLDRAGNIKDLEELGGLAIDKRGAGAPPASTS